MTLSLYSQGYYPISIFSKVLNLEGTYSSSSSFASFIGAMVDVVSFYNGLIF